MIRKAFTEHPESVGETYFQHLGMAFGFGAELLRAGVCCLLHGLFPFLFVKTGSACIEKLHRKMVTHRDRRHGDENAMPAMSRDAVADPAE